MSVGRRSACRATALTGYLTRGSWLRPPSTDPQSLELMKWDLLGRGQPVRRKGRVKNRAIPLKNRPTRLKKRPRNTTRASQRKERPARPGSDCRQGLLAPVGIGPTAGRQTSPPERLREHDRSEIELLLPRLGKRQHEPPAGESRRVPPSAQSGAGVDDVAMRVLPGRRVQGRWRAEAFKVRTLWRAFGVSRRAALFNRRCLRPRCAPSGCPAFPASCR